MFRSPTLLHKASIDSGCLMGGDGVRLIRQRVNHWGRSAHLPAPDQGRVNQRTAAPDLLPDKPLASALSGGGLHLAQRCQRMAFMRSKPVS